MARYVRRSKKWKRQCTVGNIKSTRLSNRLAPCRARLSKMITRYITILFAIVLPNGLIIYFYYDRRPLFAGRGTFLVFPLVLLEAFFIFAYSIEHVQTQEKASIMLVIFQILVLFCYLTLEVCILQFAIVLSLTYSSLTLEGKSL